MSELKQEILDLLILNGRKPQTIKNNERVVYLYDALNIVNKEFSKVEPFPNRLEKLSDIKENLEQLLVVPLPERKQGEVVESTLKAVNELIGEWSK